MPVNIFFCYAHKDEKRLNRLKAHLKPLQHEGLITVWYDRDISAGTDWEHEINEHLNAAQIILLLLSSDFMDSNYCYSIEMNRALERHTRGEARVIPIILRDVQWNRGPLGKLQALPKDGKPVTSRAWKNLDEAFTNITEGILEVIDELKKGTHLDQPIDSQAENNKDIKHNISPNQTLGKRQYDPIYPNGSRKLLVITAGTVAAGVGKEFIRQRKAHDKSEIIESVRYIDTGYLPTRYSDLRDDEWLQWSIDPCFIDNIKNYEEDYPYLREACHVSAFWANDEERGLLQRVLNAAFGQRPCTLIQSKDPTEIAIFYYADGFPMSAVTDLVGRCLEAFLKRRRSWHQGLPVYSGKDAQQRVEKTGVIDLLYRARGQM